jgi:hypothetical protein
MLAASVTELNSIFTVLAAMPAREAEERPEPAPCDRCPHAPRCAVEELACSGFGQFIAGRSWAQAPRTDASHERFVALLGEAR